VAQLHKKNIYYYYYDDDDDIKDGEISYHELFECSKTCFLIVGGYVKDIIICGS